MECNDKNSKKRQTKLGFFAPPIIYSIITRNYVNDGWNCSVKVQWTMDLTLINVIDVSSGRKTLLLGLKTFGSCLLHRCDINLQSSLFQNTFNTHKTRHGEEVPKVERGRLIFQLTGCVTHFLRALGLPWKINVGPTLKQNWVNVSC